MGKGKKMNDSRMYALEERIGDPSLFCGREREMRLLLNWASKIPGKRSKSRALLGRRKCGKTAMMERLFNTLWNRDGNVIPFYFEVLDQSQWLLDFSDEYIRTFLSQYLSFLTRTPLDENNEPWTWKQLEDMNREVSNENIALRTEIFREYLENEKSHQAMRIAFGSPVWFAGRDKVFFVVMIDEIQYMTKYIFNDEERKICANNLPGAFHGLVEMKKAPMLVSGRNAGTGIYRTNSITGCINASAGLKVPISSPTGTATRTASKNPDIIRHMLEKISNRKSCDANKT